MSISNILRTSSILFGRLGSFRLSVPHILDIFTEELE